MKREEKNSQSRQKILDSALEEFAVKGYGLSSINTICSSNDISKGNIYHYFKDKDEIYLLCIKTCFEQLTASMKDTLINQEEVSLEDYFKARLSFFNDHPLNQKLFCEAILFAPAHLKEVIEENKTSFNQFNLAILKRILNHETLKQGVTTEDALNTFLQYQDFINARFHQIIGEISLEEYEAQCRKTLNILLYGIIERKKV